MILGFTQKIKGKPNYFVRKIWVGIAKFVQLSDNSTFFDYSGMYHDRFKLYFDKPEDNSKRIKPKIHTIRKGNRWRTGMIIDFFINTRTKNMFRFAPKIPVKHVQKIKISHLKNEKGSKYIQIVIDDFLYSISTIRNIKTSKRITDLAINDGFDSAEDFLNYFNEDFEGQLIHWTDKKY